MKKWQGKTNHFVNKCNDLLKQKDLIEENQIISIRLVRDYVSRGILSKPKRLGKEVYYNSDHINQMLACRSLVKDGWSLKMISDTFQNSSNEELLSLISDNTDENDSLKLIKTYKKQNPILKSSHITDLKPTNSRFSKFYRSNYDLNNQIKKEDEPAIIDSSAPKIQTDKPMNYNIVESRDDNLLPETKKRYTERGIFKKLFKRKKKHSFDRDTDPKITNQNTGFDFLTQLQDSKPTRRVRRKISETNDSLTIDKNIFGKLINEISNLNFKISRISHDLETSRKYYNHNSEIIQLRQEVHELKKIITDELTKKNLLISKFIKTNYTKKSASHSDNRNELDNNVFNINPVFFTKVQKLPFKRNTLLFLKKNKILYLGDLIKKSETDLLRNQDFNRSSLIEIREFLNSIQLHLGMELEEWPPDNLEQLSERYNNNFEK